MNRSKRKKLEAERLRNVSADAQTIKLADIYSNTRDIVKNDPDFARTYLKEKEELLKVLTNGDQRLRKQVEAQL